MRLRELAHPYESKRIDPALMTFAEYYSMANRKNKSHPSNAYDFDLSKMSYERSEFPTLLRRIQIHNVPFEIRLKKEDRADYKMAKSTPQGDIMRDASNEVVYHSRDELLKKPNFRRYEYSVAIFRGDQCVAFTADEWGALLVVVAREYRGWGFGPIITKIARTLEPLKDSGGMTPGGYRNLMKVWREFVSEYLRNGTYSHLIRQRKISKERVQAILTSFKSLDQQLNATQEKKWFPADLNLNFNDPKDWLLYCGEAGDFVLYDSKLKNIIDGGDAFDHWIEEAIIGGIYASGFDGNGINIIHQFGGKDDRVKKFMMRLALSEIAAHGEILRFVPEVRPYVEQPGVEITESSWSRGDLEARLVSNPIDYRGMAMAEKQFRRSFDRYDEFRIQLIELAHAKFRVA